MTHLINLVTIEGAHLPSLHIGHQLLLSIPVKLIKIKEAGRQDTSFISRDLISHSPHPPVPPELLEELPVPLCQHERLNGQTGGLHLYLLEQFVIKTLLDTRVN